MIDELEQARLEKQVLAVADKTHYLLGDPYDQINGNIETEKVVLEIPKAFAHLALYLELLSNADGKTVSIWHHHQECFKRKYKYQRGAMRCYLERLIDQAMHEELHQLSTLKHPLFINP
ncbi:MAG: hypothetical protein KUG81_02720 [Gammaproteobacteria bacterium]|nr:hypothetical protein [Gammaproteobacteria bacterium]